MSSLHTAIPTPSFCSFWHGHPYIPIHFLLVFFILVQVAASRGLLHVAIPALPEYCHKCTVFLCSLVVRFPHPCFTSTADSIAKYGGRAQDLENYVMHNLTWYSTCKCNGVYRSNRVGNSSFHRVESPRYEHSGSKRHCSRKIERDSCKSHGDSCSQF